MDNLEIYNPLSVRSLFDEMSHTYGTVNLISSFGFCTIWRHQCVNQLSFSSSTTVCDLMSGMGECWRSIDSQSKTKIKVVALDFSAEMCRKAKRFINEYDGLSVEILMEDVLNNSIPNASVDCIVSTFGLKTFSEEQLQQLAAEMTRILKPGGLFSLLEISVPPNKALKAIYMVYLKRMIPLIGRALMGNADNYRMLGIYTEKFKDCRWMCEKMRQAGLSVEYRSYFFGCASSLVGSKPLNYDAV